MPGRHRARAAGVAALMLLLGACDGGAGGRAEDTGDSGDPARGGPPPNDTIARAGDSSTIVPPPAGPTRPVVAIQVGAFADSAAARALADSLRALGAAAYRSPPEPLPPGAVAKPLWRVRVAVPGAAGRDSALLVGAAALALRPGSPTDTLNRPRPLVVRDTVPASLAAPLELLQVNPGGTHGMSSRVRWTLSPDRSAIIVVEDPAAVEAEPVGNGHLYASESGPVPAIEGERSWDVQPSPDWRRLAWGRPFLVGAAERDSLSSAQWRRLARDAGLPEAEVRRGAFPASGMAIAAGLARPVVARLDSAGAPRTALRFAGGWRVRWTADGRLAVGTAPTRAQDFAPARSWLLVDLPAGRVVDTLPGDATFAEVRWVQGPTIDIGVPLDLRASGSIAVDGATVESAGGWISVRDRRTGRRRPVGPGVALAATRTGRLVAALVADPAPARFENPVSVVVYRLR